MSSRMMFKKTGQFTGKGADRKIVLGYKPAKVEIVNATDSISALKTETMPDAKALRRVQTGAGDVGDYIELNSDGFTVKAALAVSAKVLHYYAEEKLND